MYYNEVSVENEIILCIFAEKSPYNMTMWFVVHLIVTDTIAFISLGNKDWWSKFLPNIIATYWIKHLALSILMKNRAWRGITITRWGITYIFGPCMVHPSNIIYENWLCQLIIGLVACCIFSHFGVGLPGSADISRNPTRGMAPSVILQ